MTAVLLLICVAAGIILLIAYPQNDSGTAEGVKISKRKQPGAAAQGAAAVSVLPSAGDAAAEDQKKNLPLFGGGAK